MAMLADRSLKGRLVKGTKGLVIAELPKNGISAALKAKTYLRRGVARRGLAKMDEAKGDLEAACGERFRLATPQIAWCSFKNEAFLGRNGRIFTCFMWKPVSQSFPRLS